LIMRVLLTRPEPDAQRTAAALRARGHDAIVAPLLHIEILSDADLGDGPWAAMLLTSANAVRAIAAHRRCAELHAVPVYAVGQRSAQAMRDAGFADVASADGNVGDLANLVAARTKPGTPLLYLAGEERSGDLAGLLRARNFTVQTVLVYRAVAAATLPRQASDALTAGIDAVLHFSRRSAEAYVNAARNAGALGDALAKPVQLCLSGRIAEPLTAAGATKIRIAARPEEAALLELLEKT
jgi:uroporphyrinogen-III synthase